MGHHHDGLPHFAIQPLQQPENIPGGYAVQIAGGFIGDDEQGIGDDGAGDRYALLLSAGQLGRIMRRTVNQTDHFKCKLDALAPVATTQTGEQ